MGSMEIVERLNEETEVEKEKILSESRAKAEDMLKQSEKEIELQKQQFIEAEDEKGLESKKRIVRAARLNTKKLRWNAEEELIKKALEEAVKRIAVVKDEGFKGTDYSSILAGLIKDAAVSIIAGGSVTSTELEVVINAEDESYVNPDMLKEIATEVGDGGTVVDLSLAEERIKSLGGVLVRRKDGKIMVDNTFEQRMERFYTDLREVIVKELFKAEEYKG